VRLSESEAESLDSYGPTTSDALRNLIKQKAEVPEPFKEYGSSVTGSRWGGRQQEGLRELRGKAGRIKFSEMRRNNPVIGASMFAVESYLRAVQVMAEPASDSAEDVESAEFLDQAINDMSFTWDDELLFILTMLEQGFMPLEVVYKLRRGRNPRPYGGIKDPAPSRFDDGKIGWRKWAPRPPLSLTPGNEWTYDDNGGIQGINQDVTTAKGSESVPIPIESLLLFRTTPAPNNSPFGWSLLRPMFLPYYYIDNIQEIEAIGIERDLVGLPVVYLGQGTTKSTDANSDWAMARQIVEEVRNDEQAGIVLPHRKMNADGEGILFELLSSPGSKAFDTEAIINRYERRMAMVLLAQFLMLGMEKTGSYALSETQGDVFSLALSAWIKYITQTITLHAVPKLFALNPSFSRLKELPQLSYTIVGKPNIVDLARYINLLAGSMVLTPDESLEDYLREAANLPPRQKEATPSSALQLPSTTTEEEEPEEETPLDDVEMSAGWMQRTYSRWLSEMAPRLTGIPVQERSAILKAGLDALCKRLSLPPYTGSLAKAAQGPEHVVGEGLVGAVARKLMHAIAKEGATDADVLAAGASMFVHFADVRDVEHTAMQKARGDLEQMIANTLEQGDA